MKSSPMAVLVARQTVSDRIGYTVSFLFGAGMLWIGGWAGVAVWGAFYSVSVWLAYRRWRAIC